MKERHATNKIYLLHDDDQGNRIVGEQAINNEIGNFYQKLLGLSTSYLPKWFQVK